MTAPDVRCFPRDDDEFQANVLAALTATDGTTAEALSLLRDYYPRVRIVARDSMATLYGGGRWYAYRDGSAVPGGDGVGAMRAWSPIRTLTNQSLDLIEWSAALLRRSQEVLVAASRSPRTTDARSPKAEAG